MRIIGGMDTLNLSTLGLVIDFGADRVEETGDLDDARALLEAIELSLAKLRAQLEVVRASI